MRKSWVTIIAMPNLSSLMTNSGAINDEVQRLTFTCAKVCLVPSQSVQAQSHGSLGSIREPVTMVTRELGQTSWVSARQLQIGVHDKRGWWTSKSWQHSINISGNHSTVTDQLN